MPHYRLVLILSVALLTACAGPQPQPTARAPDPLLDTIIATATGQTIKAEDLYERMAQADVVYLGEKHDNPRHHALQLQALQTLLERGLRPALGFEFFAQHQTGYLQDYVQAQNKRLSDAEAAQQLRRNLGWGPQRDADWAFYLPLLQWARQQDLVVFGADLPDSLKRRLTRLGPAALSAVEQRLLQTTGFQDAAYRELMAQTLIEAHCGWNDPDLIERLYQTWLARNDAMAQAIAAMGQANTGQPIVMILGAGHIRHDMGVAERVRHLWPQARQINLAYQEVAREPQAVTAYFDDQVIVQERQFAPAFEYLWFTPRVSFDDPCKQFKTQLQKHR